MPEPEQIWKELATEADVDEVMAEVDNFHDCCLSGVRWWTNTYVDKDGSMVNAAAQRLKASMVIQQQDVPRRVYELYCEDVTDLHISMPVFEYSAALMGAVLMIRAGKRYWSADPDWTPELSDSKAANTWVACRRMWWRRADHLGGEIHCSPDGPPVTYV
jgi:hypothetical protein